MKHGGKFSAWGLSLLIHAAIAAVFVVTLRFTVPDEQAPSGEVIQAVAVDAEALRERERAKEEAERRAEEARLAELRRQREAAEAARQAELRRQEEARRQAEAEARRQREAEEAARRAAEEQARLRAEAERRRQEEAARRKAEEEARRKAEAEAKRKAEEERRRREAEEAARREREAQMLAQIEAEEQRLAAIRSGKMAEYQALITGKVMRNWSPPPNLGEDFYCEFEVRQIPGGEVVSVAAGKCDNEVLKRSAEAAIWKASPLPPPPDPSLFDQYVNVIFKPEG